jgi:hypothetical protein
LSHSQAWAGKLSITDDDLDYLTTLLLERETPLSLPELALALIENRLRTESDTIKKRYDNVRIYRPSDSYDVGQRIMFTTLGYSVATVIAVREGNNPEHNSFSVVAVQFDDDPNRTREFAAQLTTPHPLSEIDPDSIVMPGEVDLDPKAILKADRIRILDELRQRLNASDELVVLANRWFPRSLILEVNIGHLHLADAVLDLNEGGPMTTEEILQEIGGVGNAPPSLQAFSLIHAMSKDDRFDEVGPTGSVLWYLTRMEPSEVRTPPPALHYTPIDYDPSLLSEEMQALEAEIDDEYSPIELEDQEIDEATIALLYPHRRMGTFPLNAKMRAIFPTALRTPRVFVTLIDGQDGEESTGWVVREERYVYGLGRFYRKHKLPIGAYITVSHDEDDPGSIVIDFNSYKPRTEYVRLISSKNGQMSFEEHKRAIGAQYDSLMILGTDDIGGVDALGEQARQKKTSLAGIIRNILADMARLSPQQAVHAKTIYSAVNVLRRCPPGPILAMLISNPDFEYVGNHYWKLAEK